jgi:DNA-binding NtrC family response regulator
MHNQKRILIIEDEAPFCRLLHKRLARKGNIIDSFDSAEGALPVLEKKSYDVALVDIKLPGMDGIDLLATIKEKHDTEVIIITGHGTIDSAIAAMKLGAHDYITKPCKLSELDIIVQKASENKALQEINSRLKDELRLKTDYGEIVGQSKKIIELKTLIHKIAQSNSTVLIYGETGTGKELASHAVHRMSFRKNNPFIVIHCATLPDTLQESELFGYEKGAFTGAVKQKKGLVELADSGTLFIDEVGEIKPNLQVKLLRFLETNQFRRLGGEQEHQIDVRVITATNKDLLKEVKKGGFREDLYYRLKVMNLQLPPLRERKEDISLLSEYFLEKTGSNKKLTKDASEALARYSWPGNVRELANVVEVASILSKGKYIGIEDLPFRENNPATEMIKPLNEMEKEHIHQALTYCAGNKTRAAKMLGISLRNLYRKIERYNLAC